MPFYRPPRHIVCHPEPAAAGHARLAALEKDAIAKVFPLVARKATAARKYVSRRNGVVSALLGVPKVDEKIQQMATRDYPFDTSAFEIGWAGKEPRSRRTRERA